VQNLAAHLVIEEALPERAESRGRLPAPPWGRVAGAEGVEEIGAVGRHQQQSELTWVRRGVGGVGDESREQTAGCDERAVQLCGDGRVGGRRGIDGAEQRSVLGVDRHLTRHHLRDENPDALIDEIRLLAKPWGITPPPAGVVPTALWTGALDAKHPPAHARRVAALLGGDPSVTVVPGAATFGLLDIFPDALSAAGR
jgi:hypothetical protein